MRPKSFYSVLFCLGLSIFSLPIKAAECVILLHGLARTASSMNKLENFLVEADYVVANIDYPSRHHDIATLATLAIDQGLQECEEYSPSKIHFVTHSLGGILVRYYLSDRNIEGLGRVVMLGPPNGGSEVVDKMGTLPGFKLLNGPAGMQLGTGEGSVPIGLGAANFEVGIIAGTQSINFILSMIIPSVDDGKVSVENAHLENESAFMTVPSAHPFLMRNQIVIENVMAFLKQGAFLESSVLPELSKEN